MLSVACVSEEPQGEDCHILLDSQFGALSLGESELRTVTVTNLRSHGLRGLTATLTSDGGFSISGNTSNRSLDPHEAWSFEVRFQPLSPGLQTGALRVTGADCSPTELSLRGEALQSDFSSGSIDFGSVANGTSLSKTVLVHASSSIALRVIGLRSSNSMFIARGALATAGNDVSVEVVFSPVVAGTQSAEIILETNIGSTKIRASGYGGGPHLTFVPSRIDFRDVAWFSGSDNTQARFLTIQNDAIPSADGRHDFLLSSDGGLGYTFQTTSGLDGPFSLRVRNGASMPERILPGTSAQFELTFKPNSPGTTASYFTSSQYSPSPFLAISANVVLKRPCDFRVSESQPVIAVGGDKVVLVTNAGTLSDDICLFYHLVIDDPFQLITVMSELDEWIELLPGQSFEIKIHGERYVAGEYATLSFVASWPAMPISSIQASVLPE